MKIERTTRAFVRAQELHDLLGERVKVPLGARVEIILESPEAITLVFNWSEDTDQAAEVARGSYVAGLGRIDAPATGR